MNEILCVARESSKFLCDRAAQYFLSGKSLCSIHAKRLVLDGKQEEE